MINKRGITISMVTTIIIVIMILTTTIVISISNVTESSKLRIFATELNMVSDEVKYLRQKDISDTSYIQQTMVLNTTNISGSVKEEQFQGETIVSNMLPLYVINLDKIKMYNTNYGKAFQTAGLDSYAVSLTTGRVYYAKGFKANGKTYYTLTDGLYRLTGNKSKSVETIDKVIFRPSNVKWTNQPVNVKVLIPNTTDDRVVTTDLSGTGNVGQEFLENATDPYVTVNTNILNVASNYTITVTYSLASVSKTATYVVNNYDGTSPTISTGEQVVKSSEAGSETYITDVNVSDIESGTKIVKYASGNITLEFAKEYFKENGEVLEGTVIKWDDSSNDCTIYAEDNAGNYSVVNVVKSV